MTTVPAEYVDNLVIGAGTVPPLAFCLLYIGIGLSGIAAAYRFQTELPNKSFKILEGRDSIGGTWDLFR